MKGGLKWCTVESRSGGGGGGVWSGCMGRAADKSLQRFLWSDVWGSTSVQLGRVENHFKDGVQLHGDMWHSCPVEWFALSHRATQYVPGHRQFAFCRWRLLAFLVPTHFKLGFHYSYSCFIVFVFWPFLLFVLTFTSNLAAESTGTCARVLLWKMSCGIFSKIKIPFPEDKNKGNLRSLTQEQLNSEYYYLSISSQSTSYFIQHLWQQCMQAHHFDLCSVISTAWLCVMFGLRHFFDSSWLWLSPSSALLFTPQVPPGHYSSE